MFFVLLKSHVLLYNALQHTATHCNAQQCSATHCYTLQHTATHCNAQQSSATHCYTLHHTATHCKMHFLLCNTRVHILSRVFWTLEALSPRTGSSVQRPHRRQEESMLGCGECLLGYRERLLRCQVCVRVQRVCLFTLLSLHHISTLHRSVYTTLEFKKISLRCCLYITCIPYIDCSTRTKSSNSV